jgi:hypothetical protein
MLLPIQFEQQQHLCLKSSENKLLMALQPPTTNHWSWRHFDNWAGDPIRDKLRNKRSCQAGLSGWLKKE